MQHQLARVLRGFGGVYRRNGISGHELDDVGQELALRLWELTLAEGGDFHPNAFYWTVARSVAVDYRRKSARQRRATAADWLDAVAGPTPSPAYGHAWASVQAAVRHYAELAEASAPAAPTAARQIRAWFALRVENRPGRELAAELGLGPHELARVWKWAERGQALVRSLAERDPEESRAELMRRLTDGAARHDQAA